MAPVPVSPAVPMATDRSFERGDVVKVNENVFYYGGKTGTVQAVNIQNVVVRLQGGTSTPRNLCFRRWELHHVETAPGEAAKVGGR